MFNRLKQSLLVVFILSVAGTFLFGCSGSSVTPREGSINGRITTVEGNPIEDALVTWQYDRTRWALTDPSGNFHIEAIGFGDQMFQVEAFGYRTSQFKASIYSGQTTEVPAQSIESKSFEYQEITVTETSATHAVVSWKTTDYTNGYIEYGETSSMGRTVRETTGNYATTHSLTIPGLSPAKQYFFKIIASRENRNAETSVTRSFSTVSSLEDTTPPIAPTGVAASLNGQQNQATIFWAPSSDLDLKGYRVYRAEISNGTFSRVSQTLIAKGQERYVDVSVTPGKKYYYRVTSIDQAGNESGYNNQTSILVPGNISNTITWTRANSPYVLAGDLTILSTGRLNIDSGVEVLIESFDSLATGDTSKVEIIVNGAIVASAGNDIGVVFASNDTVQSKGLWKGIHFKNVENPANSLVNVTIKDADIGLTMENSAGVFDQINIIDCSTAAKIVSTANNKLSRLTATRCTTGIEASTNSSLTIESCTLVHSTKGIVSSANNGLKISGCNFIEFIDTALTSDEAGGQIEFSNNLFVSPSGLGISLLSQNPTVEYNTFDTPYAIQITQSSPILRKNILLAERSVFGTGKKAIEHLANSSPKPVFGPNNVYGFAEENSYIGCEKTSDSLSMDVLLMKEINGKTYDYRLRQAFPDNTDPWGINRIEIPYE